MLDKDKNKNKNKDTFNILALLLTLFLILTITIGVICCIVYWGRTPKPINNITKERYSRFGKYNYRECRGCKNTIIEYYSRSSENVDKIYEQLTNNDNFKKLNPPLKVKWCYLQTGTYPLNWYIEEAITSLEENYAFIKDYRVLDIVLAKLNYLEEFTTPNPSGEIKDFLWQYETTENKIHINRSY